MNGLLPKQVGDTQAAASAANAGANEREFHLREQAL
jgi:hypothetical protein